MSEEKKEPKSMSAILAQIAELGPFLPGSVRKTTCKRKNAAGQTVVYEGQPLYNFRGKDVRIPKAAYARVKAMTETHRKVEALLAELDEAAVAAWLPKGEKKKPGRSR